MSVGKALVDTLQEPPPSERATSHKPTTDELMDLIAPNRATLSTARGAGSRFARVDTNACKHAGCPDPFAGMDLSFNGKRVCSCCGAENMSWTSDSACQRTFADGPDKRQNQEYKDDENRDLHLIVYKDAPRATADQIKWANNRLNQITVWSDLLGEDSREDPEGVSLTEDEVNKMKYAARAVCVAWVNSEPSSEDDNEDAEYGSSSFWSSLLALEMMARRPDGFVLPEAKRHLGNLEGLHSYMQRYQGRESKRYAECKGTFFTKVRGKEASMGQNHLDKVATRYAAWHPLGVSGAREAKISALDNLLKRCGVWANRDANGHRVGDPVGLCEAVRLRQLPGVLTGVHQKPGRFTSSPFVIPRKTNTSMGISYRRKLKHSLYEPVPIPKPDKKRKFVPLQPLTEFEPPPPQSASPSPHANPLPAEKDVAADGPLGLDDLFGLETDALLGDAAAVTVSDTVPSSTCEDAVKEQGDQMRAIELLSLDLTAAQYEQQVEHDMNEMMLEYQNEQADEDAKQKAEAVRAEEEAAAKAEAQQMAQVVREDAYKAGQKNRLDDPRNSLEDPGHDAPDYDTLLRQGYKKRPEYKTDKEIRELSVCDVKNSGNFRRDPWSFLRKWKELQLEWREAEQDRLDRQEGAQEKKEESKRAREKAQEEKRIAVEKNEKFKLEQRGFNQILSQGVKKEQAEARAEKQGKAIAFVVPTDEVSDKRTKTIPKITIAVAQPVPGNKIAIPSNVLKKANEAREIKQKSAKGATSDWDSKVYKPRKRG